MSTNLQQVRTPLIDMDDVATHLHIKGVLTGVNEETAEEQYAPFITTDDLIKAGTDNALINYITSDTDGNPVSAKRLALAYLPQDGSNVDRNTVKNAMQLGGIDASEYYSSNSGAAAENKTAKIIEQFGADISDLKAQYTQLMNLLSKKGIIDNLRPWAGFYDTFRTTYPVHQNTYLATAFVDSQAQNMIRVKDEEIGYFSEGDYVVVVNGDDLTNIANRKLLRIDKITGSTMIFEGYTGFSIKAEQTRVYRSLGSVNKNSYEFGFTQSSYAGEKEIYTGVDDDNFRIRRKIKASNTGYATTFRINPSRANGASSYFLSNIEIAAKKIGSPGDLKCYIINAARIDEFESPQQARDTGIILAESQPLSMENKTGETIVAFDFFNDGQYALLENIDQGVGTDAGRTRFCMIIEALEADSDNYYELLFLQHYDETTNTLTDLQLNNILYEYAEEPSLTAAATDNFKTLNTDANINNADLFYGITLRPVEEGTFSAVAEGLYSAAFKTYEPIRASKAKLTLRVAREGMFTVTSTSADSSNDVKDKGTVKYIEDISYRDNSEKNLSIDGFAVLSDSGEDHNRLIVIGSNVYEIERVNGDSIVIKGGGHIEPGDPIYPLSYTAYLTCSNKQWDAETQSYKIVGDPVSVPLKTISVQPCYFEPERDIMIKMSEDETADETIRAKFRKKLAMSDNLVFEAELSDSREFNNFQLQIYWRSMANKSSSSFAGRIYDLSVSLDRAIVRGDNA